MMPRVRSAVLPGWLFLVMFLVAAGCAQRESPTSKNTRGDQAEADAAAAAPADAEPVADGRPEQRRPGSETSVAPAGGPAAAAEPQKPAAAETIVQAEHAGKTKRAGKTGYAGKIEKAEKIEAAGRAVEVREPDKAEEPEEPQVAEEQDEADKPARPETAAAERPSPAEDALAEARSKASGRSPSRQPNRSFSAASEVPESGRDWSQWGGSPARNNTPVGHNIPIDWDVGQFDRETGAWMSGTGRNIKWVVKLGSQSYGNPVVAGGRVFVGTNNSEGRLSRYPPSVDLGCLLAFDVATGKFLWQHSSEKLPTGRVHDWPLQGICCAPLVERDRLWFVTSRGEVRCLDTEGFYDGENDGPFREEPSQAKDEADVVWSFNMMKQLGVSQHNMASCSVTAAGEILFVNTSNGVDQSHINLPAPNAPSFLAMDKRTGEILWQDRSPGTNILHGQWSSPAYAVLGGVPQVIFPGGDGWLYGFLGRRTKDGKPELLWEFDANPKESKWELGGRGTRNNLIATPVVYKDRVYVAVGQDPEHGEGQGHLWCIDPTRRGDVSAELAFNVRDLEHPIPHRRIQAVIPENNEVARPNPNSAVVWHYGAFDIDGDGEVDDFYERIHRSCGTVAIKDDLLFIADFSGLFHCIDAETGRPYWTYDLLAAAWGSPLIIGDKVYIGDEDGEIAVFRLSSDPEVAMGKEAGELVPIREMSMSNSVYSTPIVAGDVLYIANRTHLFAICRQRGEPGEDSPPAEGDGLNSPDSTGPIVRPKVTRKSPFSLSAPGSAPNESDP